MANSLRPDHSWVSLQLLDIATASAFRSVNKLLYRPEDQYSIGRQKFLCRWTTSLEQFTQHSTTA